MSIAQQALSTQIITQQGVSLLFLIPLLPLLGAATITLIRRALAKLKLSHGRVDGMAGWIATAFAALSFMLTVNLALILKDGNVSMLLSPVITWFHISELNVDFALRMDYLSCVMTLVVTGVGSLIHLYAIGYMAHDDSRPRFFTYLNLFLFAMLLLVLGDNLIVMFVGWEGVGLCSYLLIGFWFKEMPNAVAGQKAFVVNRIGDAGFLLGIFILFYGTSHLDFAGIENHVRTLPPGMIEAAALLLFIGAMGKSAQIPLYVWLPDAMAGPTPVSALIHAATMVTAGVYMMTRLSFLYVLAPDTLLFVSCIGAATAFFAATIAIVQNDIKKVLAYSTVSQLGYMFMAIGAGAFSNGIYHVVTHAFFKACLFMGAGSVIMGCHHEQDMRHFGGLRKSMPITFLTYLLATAAIAGVWKTSGFYSKDAILWTVFSNPSELAARELVAGIQVRHFLWGVGLVTALMTAFYMTRSLMLTFFGKYRGHAHPHESPLVVTVPLLILAVPSIAFAMIWGESFLHMLATWTRPDLLGGHEELAHVPNYHLLEQISIVVAFVGIGAAVIVYGFRPQIARATAAAFKPIYNLLLDKWKIDELYAAIILRPIAVLSVFFFKVIDRGLIDSSVNGSALVVEASGEMVRRMQTGKIGQYAVFMVGGSLFTIVFYLLIR